MAPARAFEQRRRLFSALTSAFGVRFAGWEPWSRPDALLCLSEPDRDLAGLECPVLVLGGESKSTGATARVELLSHAAVDRRVRGLALTDRLIGLSPGSPGVREDVLARTSGGGAVWLRTRGPFPVHRVGAALPELEAGEVLYALLSRRPLATLAVVHFLRELEKDWRPPPLRASIVFDDPNLRWSSYGFIDYTRLLEHADRHGYHAAMAMIPLDAGRAHAPTVSLFRRRAERLSLVLHGNDHLKTELLSPADAESALRLGAQALRRTARFERRTGLAVDRVMMPPHGLCSRHMSEALAVLGFDALCAIHPLPWTADLPRDPPLVGWRPAEFVAGCPVIPRIPLCSSREDIGLRAFLDHPVVLYGHHEDLAAGLEPLARAADVVNGMGDAAWMSVGSIARTNHMVRWSGRLISVRPFSRRLQGSHPPAASTIRVLEPEDSLQAGVLTGWSLDGGPVLPFGASAPLSGTGEWDVRLHAGHDVAPGAVPSPGWRAWPRVRRGVTEARDRALPFVS